MLISRYVKQSEGPIILHPSPREVSDDDSDLPSIVSSVFSRGDTDSSTSSDSTSKGAVEIFAELLVADETLKPLFATAVQRIRFERLERNLVRLFESYAKDLRAEATTVLERTAVEFARKCTRSVAKSVTNHLRRNIDPSWDARNMEMHLLSAQAPRHEDRVEQYLRQITNFDYPGVSSDTKEAPHDNQVKPNYAVLDDSGSDEADRLDLPILTTELKAFMTNSNAFAGLKENFRNFVKPIAVVPISHEHTSKISSSEPSTPEKSATLDTSLIMISNIFQVFLNSLIPYAYKYIRDQVLDIVQCFSPFESPLSEYWVRLRWTCVSSKRPLSNSRESDTTIGMR